MKRFAKISVCAAMCAAVTLVMSSCSVMNKLFPSPVASSSSASSKTASAVTATAADASRNFSLAVSLDKSLNPLVTTSMNNLVLWPLMYDCISEPGQDYAPVLDLATSIDNSGTTVTVHLKSGVRFSDGSDLTAQDVVYSFELVRRTPSSYFYSHLANIASVYQSGSATVVLTLNSPDPLIGNMLDIPIIKNGTENSNASYATTGINVPPTGSGRYVFSSDSFGGTLTYNKNWHKGVVSNFKTIALTNILNDANTFQALKIGSVDFMLTDYGSGTLSAAGLGTSYIRLNRMVFIGVNSAKTQLKDSKVRSAMSQAIGRQSIVTGAYSSRAAAAIFPLNPNLSGLQKLNSAQTSANSSQAQSALIAAGYATKNSSGALTSAAGSSLAFTMLVNKNNSYMLAAAKQIVSDLNKAGVVVTTDAEAADTYSSKLASGSYDLYLGEINIQDDMDLSALLSAGGAASYGIAADSPSVTAYAAWRSGAQNLSSFTSAFSADTPFIPVCFRFGAVSYSKGLTGTVAPTLCDIFGGVDTWHF